jgi:hypothetical protein
MKLSHIILFSFCGLALLAQQPRRSPSDRTKPSDQMTTVLPDQDVTLTIHLSSDLATALEKHRRDVYTVKTDPSGVTTLQPVSGTLADAIVFALQHGYFTQVLKEYPSPTIKAAQDALTAAQRAAQEAASKAAGVK